MKTLHWDSGKCWIADHIYWQYSWTIDNIQVAQVTLRSIQGQDKYYFFNYHFLLLVWASLACFPVSCSDTAADLWGDLCSAQVPMVVSWPGLVSAQPCWGQIMVTPTTTANYNSLSFINFTNLISQVRFWRHCAFCVKNIPQLVDSQNIQYFRQFLTSFAPNFTYWSKFKLSDNLIIHSLNIIKDLSMYPNI